MNSMKNYFFAMGLFISVYFFLREYELRALDLIFIFLYNFGFLDMY
jgi:hypothetical protein